MSVIMGIVGYFIKKRLPQRVTDRLEKLYPTSLDEKITDIYKTYKEDGFIDTDFGFKMYIDYSDHVQFRYIYWDYSRWEIEQFTNLVDSTQGDFVDIGANVGFYSLLFANLADDTRTVHSFEPLPYNVDRLKINLQANGCDKVKIYEYGLGDAQKQAEITYSKSNRGAATLYKNDEGIRQTIQLKKLDRIGFIDSKEIGFLKIDVEGAEIDVLSGGFKTLKNNCIPILLEVHYNQNRRKIKILISILIELGYTQISVYDESYKLHLLDETNLPNELCERSHWVIN